MLDAAHRDGAPAWIEFRTGKHRAKMPFFISAYDCAWDKVLELTTLGFRADRVGDSIVITGRPGRAAEVLS